MKIDTICNDRFRETYERLGAETQRDEYLDLCSMGCARLPRDRSELLSDDQVAAIMQLHDNGREAAAICGIYGDDGPRLVDIAREIALRAYHRAWGF